MDAVWHWLSRLLHFACSLHFASPCQAALTWSPPGFFLSVQLLVWHHAVGEKDQLCWAVWLLYSVGGAAGMPLCCASDTRGPGVVTMPLLSLLQTALPHCCCCRPPAVLRAGDLQRRPACAWAAAGPQVGGMAVRQLLKCLAEKQPVAAYHAVPVELASATLVFTACCVSSCMLPRNSCLLLLNLLTIACLLPTPTSCFYLHTVPFPNRVPEECPAAVRDLILECLETRPSRRPSALQIVQRLQAIPAEARGTPSPRATPTAAEPAAAAAAAVAAGAGRATPTPSVSRSERQQSGGVAALPPLAPRRSEDVARPSGGSGTLLTTARVLATRSRSESLALPTSAAAQLAQQLQEWRSTATSASETAATRLSQQQQQQHSGQQQQPPPPPQPSTRGSSGGVEPEPVWHSI